MNEGVSAPRPEAASSGAPKKLESATAIDPTNDQAFWNLAFVHMEMHKFERAKHDLQQAIDRQPRGRRLPREARHRADAARGLGRKQRRAFEKSIELDPDLFKASLQARRRCSSELDNPQNALQQLHARPSKTGPRFIEAYSALGRLYADLGYLDQAIAGAQQRAARSRSKAPRTRRTCTISSAPSSSSRATTISTPSRSSAPRSRSMPSLREALFSLGWTYSRCSRQPPRRRGATCKKYVEVAAPTHRQHYLKAAQRQAGRAVALGWPAAEPMGDEEALEAPVSDEELTEEAQSSRSSTKRSSKFEGQKRWSDVIRKIDREGRDPRRHGREDRALPPSRHDVPRASSSNQAEAIKVLRAGARARDEHNLEAITRLKEMYEKRRDWESLIRHDAAWRPSFMDEADRPLRVRRRSRELATKRLRKPDICIELWAKVRESEDPRIPRRIDALSTLYERARRWEPLAEVLEMRQIDDEIPSRSMLQKLGMIYADKIGDDSGAVRTRSRSSSSSTPDDRRASEQLKRRYVALKAWDDLESTSMQRRRSGTSSSASSSARPRARRPSSRSKIALLFRAAELWIDKKDKPDRAARAYEKVLDARIRDNLAAAEALSPIYEEAGDAKQARAGLRGPPRVTTMEPARPRRTSCARVGLLYEERLRAPEDRVREVLHRGVQGRCPTQEIIREDVERLAESTGGWDEVDRGLRRPRSETPTSKTTSRSTLRIQSRRCAHAASRRTEDAIVQFRAVYDVRRATTWARSRHSSELYQQTEKFAELQEVYEQAHGARGGPGSAARARVSGAPRI